MDIVLSLMIYSITYKRGMPFVSFLLVPSLPRRSHELIPSPGQRRKTTGCLLCSSGERVVQIGFEQRT